MTSGQNSVVSGGTQKTLTYQGITFIAPNKVGNAYYVFATKDGKNLLEIGKDIVTGDQGNSSYSDGITDLSIKNIKESDLDTGTDNYQQMKAYVGKPALYISETSASSPFPSVLIVDMQTGVMVGNIAVN